MSNLFDEKEQHKKLLEFAGMTEEEFLMNLLEAHNKHGSYGENRSIYSRWFTARKKHIERAKYKFNKNRDDFSVLDLVDMGLRSWQGSHCVLCGVDFNTWVRPDEIGYSWQISHAVSPAKGGRFTRSNIILLHHVCNNFYRGNINYRDEIEGTCYGSYLDMVMSEFEDDPDYALFVKLWRQIHVEGRDPNTETWRVGKV